MYNPKVSIIIPVYNGADYLSQSIESALKQTYENLEVIVVNDGSEDNGATEVIAKSYEGRVKYFTKSNGGVSSALNYGIEQMAGEWVSWLSHDDLYYPNKIQEQMNYLNNKIIPCYRLKDFSKIVLYCNTEFINEKSEVVLRLKPIAKEFESTRDILIKNIKNNRLGGCSFLVNKKAFLDIGGFNEKIRTVSDYDFWYRLLLNNYQFYYVPKTLVQGRMHKKQVTYRLSELSYREFEEFHIRLVKKLNKKSEYDDYKIFVKIGCYALRRGYVTSARYAFQLAETRCSYLKFVTVTMIGIIHSIIYREVKNIMKYLYLKAYVK